MLLGRDEECRRLDAVLDGARAGSSGALAVRGHAGTGKTSLLTRAADTAAMPVVRLRASEAEQHISFAGLHQLVRPLQPALALLPEPQAEALSVAMGLRRGERPDRFMVYVSFCSLLTEAAARDGLACLVDDAQWLDEASADAIGFLARRLDAEGIGLLVMTRPSAGADWMAHLPVLELGGLPTDDAVRLVLDTEPSTAPSVARELVELADGNPLALRELPRSLTVRQRSGQEPLPERIPLTERLERLFLAQVRRLPLDARRALLVLAAEPALTLTSAVDVAGSMGLRPGALDAAQDAGVLVRQGDALTFSHPLVRAAIYRAASLAERREVHEALAAATAPAELGRRAWHRAATARPPDDDVAAELDRAAGDAADRGAHASAAAAHRRAAELSPTAEARGRRLLAAAESTWSAGRTAQLPPLLDQCDHLPAPPAARARCTQLRGLLRLRAGDLDAAYGCLVSGHAVAADVDVVLALDMLADAQDAARHGGAMHRLVEVAALAAGLPESADQSAVLRRSAVEGLGAVARGRPDEARRLMLVTSVLALRLGEPMFLLRAAVAHMYLGEVSVAVAAYREAAHEIRRRGALSTLPLALDTLAMANWAAGQYATATADAVEGLVLAEQTGHDNVRCSLLATLTLIAARQGRQDECRAYAMEMHAAVEGRGLGLQRALVGWALGALELSLGNADAAFAQLREVARPAPGRGHPLIGVYALPHLAESALRAGKVAEARDIVRASPSWAASGEGTQAAVRLACAVLDDQDAAPLFELAVRALDDGGLPFERAHGHLLCGEWLRRHRQRAAARPHLRTAGEVFDRIGASRWAERARLELLATGETAQRRQQGPLESLTPQELQIVRMVSEGLSNREVAGQLFLSPRTVEYHLHKVYPKLGIASRSELISRVLTGGVLV